jgi:hypothetical protein
MSRGLLTTTMTVFKFPGYSVTRIQDCLDNPAPTVLHWLRPESRSAVSAQSRQFAHRRPGIFTAGGGIQVSKLPVAKTRSIATQTAALKTGIDAMATVAVTAAQTVSSGLDSAGAGAGCRDNGLGVARQGAHREDFPPIRTGTSSSHQRTAASGVTPARQPS